MAPHFWAMGFLSPSCKFLITLKEAKPDRTQRSLAFTAKTGKIFSIEYSNNLVKSDPPKYVVGNIPLVFGPVFRDNAPSFRATGVAPVSAADHMSKLADLENISVSSHTEEQLDYFVQKDGLVFAGTHLIIDLWDADNLNNAPLIEETLRECVHVSGATLLHFHIHQFEPNGLSGVAVLAESHISFHSWPDKGYMALDIFMCGKTDPYKCIPVLKGAFTPRTVQLNEIKRGILS